MTRIPAAQGGLLLGYLKQERWLLQELVPHVAVCFQHCCQFWVPVVVAGALHLFRAPATQADGKETMPSEAPHDSWLPYASIGWQGS